MVCLAPSAGGVDEEWGGRMMTFHIESGSDNLQVGVGGFVSRRYKVSAGSRESSRCVRKELGGAC